MEPRAATTPNPASSPDASDDPPLGIGRLRSVYELTQAVSRARGLHEIYEAALDGLIRALSADRASILLFDPDDVMRFKAWRGLSDEYRAAVEGHSPWKRDTVDAEPIVVPDVLTDEAWKPYRPVFQAEGIRALGFIPLCSRGRLIGKFMVYFAAPHVFDEEEIRLGQTIAGHVAFAVDRRHREDKLALYHEIFDHSNEAIAIVRTDGIYTEQNAAHRALIGYDDADLAGQTPAIHMGEERFAEVTRALASDGIYRDEVMSRTRSGATRRIELSAFAVKDEAGEPVCFVGVERDVTERKHTEEALQFLASASAALDRSLDYDETALALAELSVPFLGDWALVETLDEQGRRVSSIGVHAEASRKTALDRLAQIRASVPADEARVPSGGAAVRLRDPADLLNGTGLEREGAALLGQLGAKSALVAPLQARGRLLGTLTVVSAGGEYGDRELALAADLGRRAATALDNARLYREAQISDRRKEEFLAVLAHELRNPLMPLLTCVELMRIDMAGSPTGAIHQEIMERQVRNLKRLVDDLLDVSRVTRGKIELKKIPVSLSAIVARAIETTRPWIEGHGLELRVAVDPGARLEADPLRLEQVFANLLSNAAKYTSPGGRIDVYGGREGDLVTLRVRDDGSGIAPDILPRVFDLFVQGVQRSQSPGGLGVGLTLVRTLVEMHGGSVGATSAGLEKGSEFVVRLPVGNVDETLAAEAPPAATVRPLRVLLVDDNVDATVALSEALRLRGHQVAVTHDGQSALEQATARPPDLVLLDLGLPDVDGYEVVRRLRALPALSGARIVALSGYGQEAFRDRSAAAGLEHVVKPVDLTELDRVLAAADAETKERG